MNFEGGLKAIVTESPRGLSISSITCFDRGIIVAGERGFITTFNGTKDDDPYKAIKEEIGAKELEDLKFIQEDNDVTSIQCSNNEDYLFFVTKHC